MVLRVDLIFSYWVIVWFLVYSVGVTIYSPKFVIIIALLENIYSGIMLRTANVQTIMSLMVLILLKMIILFVLRNDKIRAIDIFVSVILFIIYVIWVHMNNETVLGYYKKIQRSLNNNDNNTPLVHILSGMFGKS
jgi:hypothetical protein